MRKNIYSFQQPGSSIDPSLCVLDVRQRRDLGKQTPPLSSLISPHFGVLSLLRGAIESKSSELTIDTLGAAPTQTLSLHRMSQKPAHVTESKMIISWIILHTFAVSCALGKINGIKQE